MATPLRWPGANQGSPAQFATERTCHGATSMFAWNAQVFSPTAKWLGFHLENGSKEV